MPKNCISVVGGLTAPQINSQINNAGGIGNALVSAISNVLDNCELDNFGIINGEYCADQCCFPDLTERDICAVVLHECESGKIIDWKPTPLAGVACNDDGHLCVDLQCWYIGNQCDDGDPKDSIPDYTCVDPCTRYCELFNLCEYLEDRFACGENVVSWKNGNKSETYCKPDLDRLQQRVMHWYQKCLEKRSCNRSASRVMQFAASGCE